MCACHYNLGFRYIVQTHACTYECMHTIQIALQFSIYESPLQLPFCCYWKLYKQSLLSKAKSERRMWVVLSFFLLPFTLCPSVFLSLLLVLTHTHSLLSLCISIPDIMHINLNTQIKGMCTLPV